MKGKQKDFEMENNSLQFRAKTWRMNKSTLITIPAGCAKLCPVGTQVTARIIFPDPKRKSEEVVGREERNSVEM